MATLADVVRSRRQSGQSRTGSLLGSLKDKFKEKIDPRKFLNQTGVLTALFPSLKAYKAKGVSEESIQKNVLSAPQLNNASLIKLSSDSTIVAKNMLMLPLISRDINVMKQNVMKIVKGSGKQTSDKADMFFLKQAEVEKLYENQKTNSKVQQLDAPKNKTKTKSFSWLKFLSFIGIGASSLLFIDFLFRKKDSIVYDLYETLKSKVEEFQTNIKDYFKEIYDGASNTLSDTIDGIEDTLKETYESLSKLLSLDSITDLFNGGTEGKIEDILKTAKEKTVNLVNNMSIIPSAQAATLPSASELQRMREQNAPTITGVPSIAPVSPGPITLPTSPTSARISSGFGMRTHPVAGGRQHHDGIDVAVPSGTPIKSVKSGKVIFAGEQRGYGYSVEVKHDDNTSTFYAHLSSIGVRVGQAVGGGEVVGLSGGGRNDPGRGTSTGPHLHFELRVNGKKVDPGNPLALSAVSTPTFVAKDKEKESASINALSSFVEAEESTGAPATRTIIHNQTNTQVLTSERVSSLRRPDSMIDMLNYVA